MKNLLTGIFASCILLSCTATAGGSAQVGKQQASLANTGWSLAENVKGNTPTLNIENGKISGNAGCNRYFGNLTTDTANGGFVTGNIGSTKMACESMSTEQAFLNALSQSNKYVVSGNVLELYRDKLLLLKFNRTK